MKKLFCLCASVFFAFATIFSIPVNAQEINEFAEEQTVEVTTTLKNLETNSVETQTELIELEEAPQTRSGANNTYTVTAGSYVQLNENGELSIAPRASSGSNKHENGMYTEITVVYSMSGDYVNITNYSGKWVPDNSMYYMSNRNAWLTESGFGKTDRVYPQTNSYSRSIGWGNLPRYGADLAIRTGNTGYVNIVGMTARYELTLIFTI